MDFSSSDHRTSAATIKFISEKQTDCLNSNHEQEHEHGHESPRKRMKLSNLDRITNLPDALISHILSLLPLNDAVKTQFLSKAWRYAWASTPIITYSGTAFTELVSNALMLHKGPIKTLSLLEIGRRIDGPNPPINLWVQCAVSKQIEVLVLEVNPYVKSYYLPDSLFLCDSLREFILSANKFDLGLSIFWKSLKKLTLIFVKNLYCDKIHKIITGSPELESLKLSYCGGYNQIIVPSSSKLRKLKIHGYVPHRYYDDDDDDDDDEDEDEDEDENKGYKDELLVISGPSVTSLVISGDMASKHCELKNMSSLVQVSLRFWMSSISRAYLQDLFSTRPSVNGIDDKLQKCEQMMLHSLQKISHVEKLSLGDWCTQVLSMCELSYKPRTLLECKSLEINSTYIQSIPCIARLLRSSRCLERLTIFMDCFDEDTSGLLDEYYVVDGYWKSQEIAFENPWEQLKIVQLLGFDKEETILVAELAEYVLDHAKILEMLVLKPRSEVAYRRTDLPHSDSYYVNVMQKLLSSYPRCSHHARVLLL